MQPPREVAVEELRHSVQTVAIFGLGLIGGSLARDLNARGFRLLGYDSDPGAIAAALSEGVIAEEISGTLTEVETAEVIILALPVTVAPLLLPQIATHAKRAALITDVGSTKQSIVAAAERCGIGDRFVGGHPMAGDHRSGWSASRRDLLSGARVFLTPTTGVTHSALHLAHLLWHSLGGVAVEISAREHDELTAWSSHLPQLVSSALAAVLSRAGIDRVHLGAGGRDVTRLAGSSIEMWDAISRDNAEALIPALHAAEHLLEEMRLSIGGRGPQLAPLLAEARQWSEGT